MPSEPRPANDPLQRLLRLRLHGQAVLQQALLQALFGQDELAALDPRQRRRLHALLEQRDDGFLEALAWRGDAGRSQLCLQLELLLDGEIAHDESRQLSRWLLALLQREAWPGATAVVRSVVLSAALTGPAGSADRADGQAGAPAPPDDRLSR